MNKNNFMYQLSMQNITAHFQALTENIFKLQKTFQIKTPLSNKNNLQNFKAYQK